MPAAYGRERLVVPSGGADERVEFGGAAGLRVQGGAAGVDLGPVLMRVVKAVGDEEGEGEGRVGPLELGGGNGVHGLSVRCGE